ncbi:MAG: alpha/beta hydrolase, partial [Pseudomonadota bacterium]
ILKVDSYDINYNDTGSGKEIVLIHGLGADKTRWEKITPQLAENHRVVSVDLLGFGKSSKPNLNYRGQLLVQNLHRFLEKLNIKNPTLIGNSMGGWLSLLYTKMHPNSVKDLVLVGPAFIFGLPPGLTALELTKNASPQDVQTMKTYLERIYHSLPKDINFEQELKIKLSKNDKKTIESLAMSLEKKLDIFSIDDVKAIQKKVMVIHGESDGVVPMRASQVLADLLPNATFEVVKGTGHWPQYEEPIDFLDLVGQFL